MTRRERVKLALKDWAVDMAGIGATGVSPMQMIQEMRMVEAANDPRMPAQTILRDGQGKEVGFLSSGVQHAVESQRARKPSGLSYFKLKPQTVEMARILKIIRGVDRNYYKTAWVWAATGSMDKTAEELGVTRPTVEKWFEGAMGILLLKIR